MSEPEKQSDFIANFSSELKSPLTMMLAPLESLLMGEHGPVSEEQSAVLETVHGNSVKLLQMISGWLDVSNAEAGKINVNRQPVNIKALAHSIYSEFEPAARANQLDFRVEINSNSSTVLIDRYLFERILFNLLSNAIKFTPAGGKVGVSIALNDERLILRVADTGHGISQQQTQNLFLEFKQHDVASMRRFEGVGLGLALVKEFATLLEGTVTVQSAVGVGSTFTVDIKAPLTEEKPLEEHTTRDPATLLTHLEPPEPHRTKERRERSKHLPRVLLAESNVELAGYVEDLLADLCQTNVAPDGEEALRLVSEWQPDLILASVAMPKLDGLSLCRTIKSRSETSFIPVVLLTAMTQRDAMLQGWEAGADEYLFKPFHPAELVTRIRSLLRSVQQRKRAQEQIERLNEALEKRVIELASANRELKSLANMLEQARDQALDASKFKSVFLANMSHEIRTPINGVISMSDMLMRTRLGTEQVEIANIIRDSAGALLDLINDILDFSKIEAGKVDLEIVDFDLASVVEGTAELVAAQARQKRLSLMTYVAPEVPQVLRGDPGRLRQILLNLLSNAIKFTDSGEVIVRAFLEGREQGKCLLRFSITDSGIGMAQHTVERLFKPFTQADGSITRKYGGTGLGLSIAKLLVELLGGKIGVKSAEGQGSTFWFTVPLEVKNETPALHQGAEKFKGLRILIVDPMPGSAKIVEDYASSWGVETTVVSSGVHALTALNQAQRSGTPFDVAIVELVMPDMDGFMLAREIKTVGVFEHTKLVLCTAFDQEYLGERALRSGYSAYLIKPLKYSRLHDCIALVLELEGAVRIGEQSSAMRVSTTGEVAVFQNTGMVLVAEDNPVNQKVALLLLKELGFAAHMVGSGREAVEAIHRAPYALILMDCQMPDMDGFEATGAIRMAETLTGRHIPIIAMTAHAMQGDREKCIAAGMDDYVSKPVTAGKLKEVLLRWFRTDTNAWRAAEIPIADAAGERPDEPGTNSANPQSPDPCLSESGNKSVKIVSAEAHFVPPESLVNFEHLRTTCGDDGACELLEIFIDSTGALLARIDDSVMRRDHKALKSGAHELKGACASVGSNEMAALAKTLEHSAADQDWPALEGMAAKLNSIFERVAEHCRALLRTHSAQI